MTSERPRSADVALSERHLYPSPADTRKCHQNVRSRKNLQVSDLSVLARKEVYAYLRPARAHMCVCVTRVSESFLGISEKPSIFFLFRFTNLPTASAATDLIYKYPHEVKGDLHPGNIFFFLILQRAIGRGAHVPVLSWPQVDHHRNDFNHVALGPGTDHMGQVYSKAGRNLNILNSVVVSGW